MVMGNVLFDTLTQSPQQAVDAADLGLELGVDARAAAGRLTFEIDAWPVVARTPRARWFGWFIGLWSAFRSILSVLSSFLVCLYGDRYTQSGCDGLTSVTLDLARLAEFASGSLSAPSTYLVARMS